MKTQNGQKFYKEYDVDIDNEKRMVTLSLSHDKSQMASYPFEHFGIGVGEEEYLEDAVRAWIDELELYETELAKIREEFDAKIREELE